MLNAAVFIPSELLRLAVKNCDGLDISSLINIIHEDDFKLRINVYDADVCGCSARLCSPLIPPGLYADHMGLPQYHVNV